MARKEVKKTVPVHGKNILLSTEDLDMAKAKKSKAKAKANQPTFLFASKNGDKVSKVKEPKENCKASQVVLAVLASGKAPEGCQLRYAESYGAHFVMRKGKNALGYFDTANTLVVNGIAEDLEKLGVKTFRPSSSKNYRAINLKDMTGDDIKKLVSNIKKVLGFGKTNATEAKVSKKDAEASGEEAAASTATA